MVKNNSIIWTLFQWWLCCLSWLTQSLNHFKCLCPWKKCITKSRPIIHSLSKINTQQAKIYTHIYNNNYPFASIRTVYIFHSLSSSSSTCRKYFQVHFHWKKKTPKSITCVYFCMTKSLCTKTYARSSALNAFHSSSILLS